MGSNPAEAELAALAHRLREDKAIKDAEIMPGPGEAITAVIVQQGVRPGPVLRHRAMKLAGSAAEQVQVLLMPAIPRLADGSLDHGEVLARIDDAYRFEAPATDDERSLAELVSRVLPGQRISMTDAVGDLGGDSIATFELAALISERFGIEVSAYQLFMANSIRDIAALVGAEAESRT
jgi:acyl carrier protein